MAHGKLVLRNYRCFDWENPMELEFGEGFTAIVGPNNSGKSSALRSVFELRNVFTNVLGTFQPNNRFRVGGNLGLGISDIAELANDADPSRFQLAIELSLPTDFQHVNHYAAVKVRLEYRIQEQVLYPLQVCAVNQNGNEFVMDEDALRTGSVPESPFLLFYSNNNITIDFTKIVDFSNTLAQSKYFPAFRNAINEGAAQHYDIPVGTALVASWDSWKAGNNRAQKIAISQVEHEIASLLGFRTLQINADQSNKTLDVIINGRPHKLYEVGAGVAQLIITLAAALVSRPPYILIDEPELNLHPALQLKFLSTLASYATQGVLYATHSIGLARSSAVRIYSVSKEPDESSRMRILGESIPSYSAWLGELSYTSRMEIGCEGILLIEGPSEVLCFQEFLRKIGKDQKYVLMQLGGSSLINANVEPHLLELTRIVDPTKIHAYIDSERESENVPLAPDRQGFLDVCQRIGIDAQASQRRATENYFSQQAITKALGASFQSLSEFQRLKDVSRRWHKSDNWKIAREMEFSDIEATDLGRFLVTL